MPKTWTELLTENKEDILDTLKSAYRTACGSEAGKAREEVIINRKGRIRTATLTGQSMPMDVWKGEAMTIGSIAWFDPLDSVELNDAMKFLWSEDLLDAWISWLRQEEYLEEREEASTNTLGRLSWTIREWNPDAWKKYMGELTDFIVGENAQDFADREYQAALERAAGHDQT